MRNKRVSVAASIFVLIAMVLMVSIFLSNKKNSGTVDIHGLTKCSVDINKDVIKNIDSKMYSLVQSANSYNKATTADSYKATVRPGSCQEPKKSSTTDPNGKPRTIRTTTLIVDVPDAKQSWKIAYDWITKDESMSGIDLGTIQPSCLPKEQLLYGDFKCENILSLVKYDTDKPDPILQYMPYTGAGFRMEYNPDSRTVSIAFDPPPGTTDTAAFIANTKAIIPYWFQKRNLDQNNYKIIYSDQIDSPDDNQQ